MKKWQKKRALRGIGLLLTCCLAGISSASAQMGKSLLISAPEIDNYPEITLYIDPIERDGSSLQGLSAELITLSEDGIRRELLDFQELQPGIQLVVAFNLSNPFAIQDINGNSRFDIIKESLLNWAAQPMETSPDDLSIVSNANLESVHLSDRQEWINVLGDYSPEPRDIESDFSVLARAIEIASDPVDQPGMKRVVLLFSAQPGSDSLTAIDSLISQAKDNQVLVYSVLVSSPAFYETEGAQILNNLSMETGGVFLTFSGEEPFSDLNQLLHPLRSTYLLRYQSSIVTSGSHSLEVLIRATPADILGQREFTLDIQPPNPIFISPPRTITRTAADNYSEEGEELILIPDTISLPVLVEFPDGLSRELEELILRVDGEIAERITSPPYDQVIWDLSDYQSTGIHYLSLEAVDIMGLTKMSVETPIKINVDLPTQKIGSIIRRNAPAFATLGFILLLGMTLFVLIYKGTIQPGRDKMVPWIVSHRRRTGAFIQKIVSPAGSMKVDENEAKSQYYRLIPINDISRQLFAEPITVVKKETILGNKAGENLIRIQHPSVIAKHTQISVRDDEQYQIIDFGSTAGTWINYQQISGTKSHFIKDGDIIHIGEVAFRFQIIPTTLEPLQDEENTS